MVWSLFSGAWELGLARNAFVLDLSEAAGPHLRSFMHCWLGHSLEKTPHSNVALQSKSLKAESEEKHQSKNSKWTERGERAVLTIFIIREGAQKPFFRT